MRLITAAANICLALITYQTGHLLVWDLFYDDPHFTEAQND